MSSHMDTRIANRRTIIMVGALAILALSLVMAVSHFTSSESQPPYRTSIKYFHYDWRLESGEYGSFTTSKDGFIVAQDDSSSIATQSDSETIKEIERIANEAKVWQWNGQYGQFSKHEDQSWFGLEIIYTDNTKINADGVLPTGEDGEAHQQLRDYLSEVIRTHS